MNKTIVITDLTQMPKADEVCVVGIDEENNNIRPVLPESVLKKHLYVGDRLIIRPRAKVEFKFHRVPVEPPHVEDLGFDPKSIVYKGLCTDTEWEKVLRDSSFSSVDEIFGRFLRQHRWVKRGANTRSIGTLSQVRITSVQLPTTSGKLKYQLSFRDRAGFLNKDFPISDLAFRQLVFMEVKRRGRDTDTVAREIAAFLEAADRVYLRIGLARPWIKEDTKLEACWTQVTAIHTFPDYLSGRTFADF